MHDVLQFSHLCGCGWRQDITHCDCSYLAKSSRQDFSPEVMLKRSTAFKNHSCAFSDKGTFEIQTLTRNTRMCVSDQCCKKRRGSEVGSYRHRQLEDRRITLLDVQWTLRLVDAFTSSTPSTCPTHMPSFHYSVELVCLYGVRHFRRGLHRQNTAEFVLSIFGCNKSLYCYVFRCVLRRIMLVYIDCVWKKAKTVLQV